MSDLEASVEVIMQLLLILSLSCKSSSLFNLSLIKIITLINSDLLLLLIEKFVFVAYLAQRQTLTDLEASVEVPVQPLHDEQHGDAGAVGVGVVDDRAVQVDQPLVFGQRPAAGWRQ